MLAVNISYYLFSRFINQIYRIFIHWFHLSNAYYVSEKETEIWVNQTASPMKAKTNLIKYTEYGQLLSHTEGKEKNIFSNWLIWINYISNCVPFPIMQHTHKLNHTRNNFLCAMNCPQSWNTRFFTKMIWLFSKRWCHFYSVHVCVWGGLLQFWVWEHKKYPWP